MHWKPKYFTYAELIFSFTGTRLGLDNTPPLEMLVNLNELGVKLLDPIRELAGHPVRVLSGYRSPAVNKKVGGSKTSQHMEGFAADIVCPSLGHRAFFELIRQSGLPIDQLIDEFGEWCHVSYSSNPIGQVLIARRVNGKTRYTKFSA